MTVTTVPDRSALRGSRRAAVIVIIVSLSISAILGIVTLLGGEFGELQGKVLLTTLVMGAFSITALCHLAIVGRALQWVGFTGIIVSIGAATVALVLIWVFLTFNTESNVEVRDALVKALAVLSIFAVSLAQANLLLVLWVRRTRIVRVALVITIACIAIVAVMAVIPILTEGRFPGDNLGEAYWRIFGVIAILDALGSIVLPILGRVLPDGVVREEALPEGALQGGGLQGGGLQGGGLPEGARPVGALPAASPDSAGENPSMAAPTISVTLSAMVVAALELRARESGESVEVAASVILTQALIPDAGE